MVVHEAQSEQNSCSSHGLPHTGHSECNFSQKMTHFIPPNKGLHDISHMIIMSKHHVQAPHLKQTRPLVQLCHRTPARVHNLCQPSYRAYTERGISVSSLEDLDLEGNDLGTLPESELQKFFAMLFTLLQFSNLPLNLKYNQLEPHHFSLMHNFWKMNAVQSGKLLVNQFTSYTVEKLYSGRCIRSQHACIKAASTKYCNACTLHVTFHTLRQVCVMIYVDIIRQSSEQYSGIQISQFQCQRVLGTLIGSGLHISRSFLFNCFHSCRPPMQSFKVEFKLEVLFEDGLHLFGGHLQVGSSFKQLAAKETKE